MPRRKNITYSARPTHAARSAHAKGDKAFRTYDTTAIRPKRSPIPAIIGTIVLVVLLAGIIYFVLTTTHACTPSAQLVAKGTEVEIVIEEGEGANSVAKTLVDAGLISNTKEFTNRVSALGAEGSLQPGKYKLVGGQSVDEMIKVLQTPIIGDTFTVPEGSTASQTAEIVAAASGGRISTQDFINAAGSASNYVDSYPWLAEAAEAGASLEGYLFPKTYAISEDSTAETIVRSMLDQFATETAGLDYSYAESRGLSQYDVVKLASVIEKESDADHRATVSSVFYNRIDAGMRLQSDATVAYVVGHDPTPEDIEIDSPYNTYNVDGLPAGPINSPSLAALQAACAPEETGYYYFYFEGDGNGGLKYSFSETYEEHQTSWQ